MTTTDELSIPSGEFITTFNALDQQHLLALKKQPDLTGSSRSKHKPEPKHPCIAVTPLIRH